MGEPEEKFEAQMGEDQVRKSRIPPRSVERISTEKISVLEERPRIIYKKPAGPEVPQHILERRRDEKIEERKAQLGVAFGKAKSVLRSGLSTASAMAHKMAEPPPKVKKAAIRKAYITKAPSGRRTKRRSRRELVYIEEPVIHEEFKSPSQSMMDKIAGSSGPAQESHLDRLFGSGSSGGGEHPTDTYMRRLMGNGGKKKGKGGTGGLPYKL